MNISDDALRDVFAGLLKTIDEENQKRFERLEEVADSPAIRLALEKVRAGDVKSFYYTLLHPLGSAVDGLLARELPGNRPAQFLFTQGNSVTLHLRNLYEKYEGSACCMDKARAVVRKLARFLMTGEEISFDAEGPYRFHIPTSILCRHQDIVSFFEALQALSHGRPGPYLKALESIEATHQAASLTPSSAKPDVI